MQGELSSFIEEKTPTWGCEMTWCNSNTSQQEEDGREIRIVSNEKHIVTCPSCGNTMELQDQAGIQDLPGLPAGVKFDPSDQEILEHLEAKVWSNTRKTHPLINEFIPTLEGENGICYTHPEKLPGVSKDGLIRHFFHRPSKAYTTGTRKRRKVHTDEEGGETRWHKTGKTRAVLSGGRIKGFKKILVLYTNYGRQRKPEKTNWVMHQYHLGDNEEEKDGELVASKVFYQTQPRQCGSSVKDSISPMKSSRNLSTGTYTLNKETTATNVDYYNNPLIGYNVEEQNGEIPAQLIPNLVLQGGGSSSFMHNIAANASKGEVLERK